MRTKIQSPNGFASLVSDVDELIPMIQSDLKGGDIQKDKISSISIFLIHNMEQKNIALYSNGSSKEEVKLSVIETITAFEDGFSFHPAEMDTLHWLVSMAILCNVDLEDFKRITKVIERDKVQDKLLDFLIKYKQTDWTGNSQSFIQKTPYAELSKVIDETNAESGIKQLQNYLQNKWYQGHDKMDTAWVDNHLNTKVNTYFGYWAWETAAIIKAKGWHDKDLKDQDYYPYDAVHW